MDTSSLRQLVYRPKEGAKLDFKIELYKIYEPKPTVSDEIQKWADAKERQWAELVKDVLALTNGNIGTAEQTGYLIIGADDKLKADGTPTLRDVGNAVPTRKEILEKVNTYCNPHLPDLLCEEISIDSVKLFVISIPQTPYLHRLSKQLKTPKKEYSPYTVLIRRGDGERTYEASPDEQTAIEQEKRTMYERRSQRLDKDLEESALATDGELSTLRKLLENQKWQEADIETAKLIGGIPSPEIRKFSVTTLSKVDQLWSHFSNNRFGFSAQRRSLDAAFDGSNVTPETCFSDYQMVMPKNIEEYNDRLSERKRFFAERIGWYANGLWIGKVDYSLNVVQTKPEGYLPVLGTFPENLFANWLDNGVVVPGLWILLQHLKQG